MIANLLRMQLLEEGEVATSYGGTPEEHEKRLADGRPAWMRTLHTSVTTWLQLVPKVIPQFLSKILSTKYDDVILSFSCQMYLNSIYIYCYLKLN